MRTHRFEAPDETRPAASGKAEILDLGTATFKGVTLPPGWRWSTDVKPIADGSSCQASHLGHVTSGRMHTVMDDGTEDNVAPGDVMNLPPGHDAWVVGSEPYVALDITGSSVWAKGRP